MLSNFIKSEIKSLTMPTFNIWHVNVTWNSVDEYMSDFRAKYRNNYRKVYKQLVDKNIKIELIDDYDSNINKAMTLIKNQNANSKYSMSMSLNTQFLMELKKIYGKKLFLLGAKKDGELIAAFLFYYSK